MEQHPVPQNVTTFQFRLIGDMTIKQFGYLCGGAILAFIAYKLPLPFIITWPLTGAFAFLGVGFAFIPIEERPMDVWVFSFFKSIYNPTQYIWSHTAQTQTVKAPPAAPAPAKPAPQPVVPAAVAPTSPQAAPVTPSVTPKSALSGLFQSNTQQAIPQGTVTVAKPHHSFMDDLFAFFQPKSPKSTDKPVIPDPSLAVAGYRPAATAPAPAVVQTTTAQEIAMQQKMKQLEDTLMTLEARLATKSVTEDRVLELQKQLTDVLAAKNKTEDELISLKRTVAPKTPPQTAKDATMTRGTVNVITTQEGAVKVGLPRLTNVPNVITGLVKDDAGNLLPGILVTVTNHEGVPVRALKTNKLGQFAASTQLMSGVYFVEIEDPRGRFTFTRVQITLNGAVVPVLEILARSEKALTREKLAQEIFGKTSM